MARPLHEHPFAEMDPDRWRTACHEAGHAVMASAVLGLRVRKVVVLRKRPRGGSRSRGWVQHEPPRRPEHGLLLAGAGLAGERIGTGGTGKGWGGDLRYVRGLLSPTIGAVAVPRAGPPPGLGSGLAFRSFEDLSRWVSAFEDEAPESVLARASWIAMPFLEAREEGLGALARWTWAFGEASEEDVTDLLEVRLPGYLRAS
jgi:hypothetical protein